MLLGAKKIRKKDLREFGGKLALYVGSKRVLEELKHCM